MAFTNQSFDFRNVTMSDVMNPMVSYYAEQSASHAQRNPNDPVAQQQAQLWANVLAQQRQALQQGGFQPAPQPAPPAPTAQAPTPPTSVQQMPMPVPSNMGPAFTETRAVGSQGVASGQHPLVQ